MKVFFALLNFLSCAWAISQGIPPQCNIYIGGNPVSFGCNTFGIKNGLPNSRLNCTEPSPGIMPWALRPVAGVGKYTLRTGDGTGADPTTYIPGQLMVLYLRVLDYNYKFRGLLGYARKVSDPASRVGDWEQPDTQLYNSPWPPGNACQGGISHSSARIKPYLSLLYFRAPPAGTGDIKFEFLIKQGDANTGAFFYPATQLVLQEATTPATPQGVFQAPPGSNCTAACRALGSACDPTAQQLLATGGLAQFQSAVSPWYSCDHLMAACDIADPLRLPVTNDCTYFDAATCPGTTTPASTCDAVSDPLVGRLCACKPDPCYPNPCSAAGSSACTIDTTVTGGALTEASFRCTCNTGFGGVLCDQLQPTCGANQFPCLNGGTCVPGSGQVSCDCTSSNTGAYTGKTCEIPPPCNANPCTTVDTAATCLNLDTGGRNFTAQCQCSTGYSGPLCTVIDGCALRSVAGLQCQNGGICIDNPDDADPRQSSCNCPLGFIGSRCETDLNECAFGSNPCIHGLCVNQIGTFSCTCDAGWAGSLCDQDLATSTNITWCSPVNPCVNSNGCSECPNGAGCTAADLQGQATSYHCDCRFGYSGKQCTQLTDFCNPNPCQNGGICSTDLIASPTTGYVCTCPAGYSGNLCETNIPDCPTTGVPCANDGTCVDGVNSWTCQCTAGWSGSNCLAKVVTASVLSCSTDSDCPGQDSCAPSTCQGVGQFAACSPAIGCLVNDDCPAEYTCTGSLASGQTYCCKDSSNPNNNPANVLSPF